MQEFIGQCFMLLIGTLGFIGFMMKRADKEGHIKKAAGRAAVRGGISIFKHLMK